MKHLSIVRYILIAVSVLSILLYFTNSVDVDLMLRWGYIMVAITVASVILLPLYNLIQNPKGAVRSLMGLVIIAVVVGVSYALSSAETVVTPATVYDDPLTLRFSDTGLYTTYIAFAATILAIFAGEIRNVLK